MSTTTEQRSSETPEEYMRREIELFRHKIGIDFADPMYNPRYHVAAADNIRRFCYGLGDDNPLWLDRDYATATRWQGMIAPPGFLVSAGKTLTEFAPTAEEATRGAGAFDGLNLMQVGTNVHWYHPVREGDSLFLRTFYIDCVLRGSEASGWVAISTFRQVYWNQHHEMVCTWDVDAIHPYNQPKVNYVPPPRSTEYLDGIDAAYDSEEIRGSDKRYVESVSVGDQLPNLTKGPLTSSDVVAWNQGAGRHEVAPNRLGRKKRRAGEVAYIQNKAGGWDSFMSCHWDPTVSSAFGMAQPFDWGIMRSVYMMHLISDWMGDDALLIEVRDRTRSINVLGNVTTVTGQITEVSQHNGWPEVVIEARCVNQDDVVTATATARVRLPSSELGLPEYPAEPADQGLLPGMVGYPAG